MDERRRGVARSWAQLLIYVALVLGALPFTRGLLLGLRELDLLGAAIFAIYGVALLVVVHRVVFDPRQHDFVAFVAVVGLAGIVAALMTGIEIAEERVHFMQYGLMAVLAAGALRWHVSVAQAYLGALVLTTLVGWGDEVLQDVLPYRYYDLRDVVLNGEGAGLGLLFDEALADRLGWRGWFRRSDGARTDRG